MRTVSIHNYGSMSSLKAIPRYCIVHRYYTRFIASIARAHSAHIFTTWRASYEAKLARKIKSHLLSFLLIYSLVEFSRSLRAYEFIFRRAPAKVGSFLKLLIASIHSNEQVNMSMVVYQSSLC